MNKKEFLYQCQKRGICGKQRADDYVKTKPEEHIFTEQDLQDVFTLDEERYWAREDKNHLTLSYDSANAGKRLVW